MNYRRKEKKFRLSINQICCIILAVILLGAALSVLLPMFKIEAEFTLQFKDKLIQYYKQLGSQLDFSQITGNTFVVYGYQFTFGHEVSEVLMDLYQEDLPIQLQTNVFMIIYYCLPLIIIPFLFLFNKNEKTRKIKNLIIGCVLLLIGIFYFIYTKNEIDNITSVLTEQLPSFDQPAYKEVTITRYGLQGFLNMLMLLSSVAYFYLASISFDKEGKIIKK